MTFTLPELPFAKDALEPHMSSKTLEFHHGKHHNAYVTKLNGLIEATEFEGLALEEIIKKSANDDSKTGIFNNAAQVWNHTFFWHSLSPNGGGNPTGELADRINSDFESLDQFKKDFVNAGVGQFGSGWAWLVEEAGQLRIVKTPNAETPITKGQKPLLTVDVWEHAYYLDFQNRRPDFIETFLDNLINWDFAAQNLSSGESFKVAA